MSIVVLELDHGDIGAVRAALEGAGFDVSTGTPSDVANAVDLVVVGTARPRDAALTIVRRLRLSGYAGGIVAVGADVEMDGVPCLDDGADDFVRRPIRPRELVARVRAVLRRLTGHVRSEHGPLAIDRSRRVATLRGRTLALTSREYALLLHLAEAGGRTLTRADLHAAVWGAGGDARSNLVQVNLSRLRDKLGADAALLETVRRGGYRFRG